VGQTGIVGYVARTGKSRIALDVGSDAVFFDNPDLPNTRSEMALPLRVGDDIIGALDLQSVARAAFTPEDVDTLSLLADQISIAIQNARLFEETRLALAEAQSAYSQSAQIGWRDIARRGTTGYRFANGQIEAFKEPVTESVSAAKTGKKGSPGVNPGSPELLSIPISVRGEKLGILNIRQMGRTTTWSDAEVRLYQSIVERLSFALENARLIEETTNRAERDRTITAISDKLSSSAMTEAILRTAAEEISRVLQGSEVLVQLQPGTFKDSDPGITR
jgi:GAF domain-containing protein